MQTRAQNTPRYDHLLPQAWRILLVAVAVLAVGNMGVVGDPPIADAKQRGDITPVLVERYRELVAGLHLLEHGTTVPVALDPCVYPDPMDNVFGRATITLGPPKVRVSMTFDALSGRLLDVANLGLWDYLYRTKPPRLGDTVPAHLSRAKAIERAGYWLVKILGAFPTDVWSEPTVEYYETGGDEKGNQRGKWFVTWFRSLNGYRFRDDTVGVTFLEDYGLSGFTDARLSDLCPTEVKIDREKAIALAHPAGQRLMRKFSDLYPSGEPGEAASTELQIVNPNHILSDSFKSPWDLGHNPGPATRLAWVIGFKGYTHPREVDHQPEPVQTVEIWIDAATGEAIGGSFFLHMVTKH